MKTIELPDLGPSLKWVYEGIDGRPGRLFPRLKIKQKGLFGWKTIASVVVIENPFLNKDIVLLRAAQECLTIARYR